MVETAVVPDSHRSLPPDNHRSDEPARVKMRTERLTVHYGQTAAVRDASLDILPARVLALIGPSGCGKSSFLRSLNRMNETIDGATVSGRVLLDGEDIYARDVDPVLIRRRVGMVFQKANPFPRSIFENVAYGLRIGSESNRSALAEKVEHALRRAILWDEVKDRLGHSGLALSVGQQQRLCMARALAVEPEVLLMDEPSSSLDPIATAKIEELVAELREQLAVVLVTQNMQQAARVSQQTAFFHMGKLIEVGNTQTIFTRPLQRETEDYITGRFG